MLRRMSPTTPEERKEQRLRIWEIMKEEAELCRTTPEMLASHNRAAWIVALRERVMWRARHEVRASYPLIGEMLRRTHGAVIMGIRRYEKR